MGVSFPGWEGGGLCPRAPWRRWAGHHAGLGLALSALLFGVAGCSRDSSSSTTANVLLVTLDTVRADRLGSYGYAAASTPALDGLALGGIRFSQAVATAPLTLPSHATILTGLFPPRHAVHQNGAVALPAAVPTLAEALHGEGYRTAAFVGSFVLDARFGLGRGFELYDDDIARDPTTAAPGLEAERPGVEVVDRALSWLAADDPRPFFAWVHLYDAHAPYEPPEPYRGRFADRPYDGEIAAVDAQVARLLTYLDQRGLAGDTIVAVAADHGEALGEHGELTHGLLLFEPTLRVPLLMRAPGRLPRGVVIAEPVGLADVAPTLAGLAGVELAPPGTTLDGRDLSASLASGDEPAANRSLRRDRVSAAVRLERPGRAPARSRQVRRGADAPTVRPRVRSRRDVEPVATPAIAGRRRWRRRWRHCRPGASPPRPRPASPLSTPKRAPSSRRWAISRAAPRPARRRRPAPTRTTASRSSARSRKRTGRRSAAVRPQAARLLEPLVEGDPDNAVFRAHLARAYRESGELGASVREYRRAFASSPGDSQVGYELALALQASGNIDEATTVLAVVLQSDAARPEAHNALGILYSLQGQADQARQEFERALAIDPDDAVVLNNLGNSLRDLERPEPAASAYRRAIALAPNYAEPLNGLGSVLVAEGGPAEALPLFERALELAPDRHEIRLNRAVALELLGDRVAAIHAYRDFLAAAESDPHFAEQRAMAIELASRLEERASSEPSRN